MGNIHLHQHAQGGEEDHGERGREIHGSKNVLLNVWEKVRAASNSRTRTEGNAQPVVAVTSGDDK